MNENQVKFIEILKEMFQLNNSDLDFGIYKVLKIKQKEINNFLEKDLTNIINSNLKAEYLELEKEKLNEIERLSKSAKELGQNPDDVPKIKELKKEVKNIQNVTNSLENDIYSRLYDFFSRYYKNGDFVSLRRYKNKDTYAIPYNGEEVKLYWANFDQYYIKTSELFNDFSFTINDKKIHFKIKEVEENKDNNKNSIKKFIFANLEQNKNELNIYFKYKSIKGNKAQNNFNIESIEKIFNLIDDEYKTILSQKVPTAKNPNRTILEKYLTQYTSKNKFDFFIHKNLKEFLERELEFYIKNEMLCIDDLDEKNYKNIITKIKIFKQIANKIIEFLSQLEEFQKKLWEKKKFVIETNYLITLDKIDESFYNEILANKAQLKEWKKLFNVEIKNIEELDKENFLVLDTKFFDNDFKYRLLSQFDNLDEEINGILINSENFQALNLLIEKYKKKIKTIYIDPPYNTGNGDFIYADNFQHSSWLTMMYDRLQFAREFLKDDGVIFSSIDTSKNSSIGTPENPYLNILFDIIFNRRNFIGILHWKKKKQPSFLSKIASIMENIFIYAKNEEKIKQLSIDTISDSNKPIINADNKEQILFFKKGIKCKANMPIIKKGKYTNKSMSIEFLNNVKILNGRTQNDAKIKAQFRTDQNNINKFIEEDLIYITKNLGLRRDVSEAEKGKNKSITDLLLDWGQNQDGDSLIKNLFGVDKNNIFSNPKPIKLLKNIVKSNDDNNSNNSYILDFFAGSGTTGDAVIRLNRKDKGKRKYILVEMGEYFDKVLKTRIQKVIYSDEYENGKPQNKNGISQIVKYLKLESYEDTLNNIEFKQNKLNDTLKTQYMLKYFLDIETKKSLFNIDKFKTPFSYELEIATSNVNEIQNIKVDLIETFNYLLGIEVKKIDYSKDKILITAKKENKNILIIWRDIEEELKLDINLNDFNEVYINGDNEIGAKLIESEFKDLMFKGIK